MKYVDEYRDREAAARYVEAIHAQTTKPWTLMEVCGGQTHTIVKYGIDVLLPNSITLLHGPGCPVCVTPLELIDKAILIAARHDVIFCSFGDMLRVPGSASDLLSVKARGGDVRIVYSPIDAVDIAQKSPGKNVVFFAVGFETTAPANAMAVFSAWQRGVRNLFLLVSQVLVPPALRAILESPENRTQAFLAAGHVCTVMGYGEYHAISEKYHVPIVVTGFEPVDILQGVLMCVRQLEAGLHQVENQYTRSVRADGNIWAQELIRRVFRVVPRKWRGVGEIPQSGLGLRDEFAAFDAERHFGLQEHTVAESSDCISGDILRGAKRPHECVLFGKICNPENPVGALMVSNEGACAAYHRYRRAPALQSTEVSP